ncbi:MAG: hypothetical protein V1900_01410 [Candidatus Aenigmatarchaeota archaeon]
MFDILPFTSMSNLTLYFVNSLIAFVAVMLSDEIIAHNIEVKHALILSVLSFFVAPVVAPLVGLSGIYALILIPLVVWVLLGEIVLEADWETKLKVLLVAFAVYYILSIVLGDMIVGFIGRFI